MPTLLQKFNIMEECRRLRWGLWQCPPFLTLVTGITTVVSMLGTHLVASRYAEEPEIAALIVISVTVVLLVGGNIIITGFNRLAEAHHIKSEFVSIVSHQLRTPLSIFKWTLDLFERDWGERGRTTDWRNSFETMRMNTEHMILLVQGLLEVSRIEAATVALRRDPVSLSEVTRRVAEDFRVYARASNVIISIEEDLDVPVVTADEERVQMVIQNLIDNAIRYTARSGSVRISIRREGQSARWIIADQGSGIPAGDQPRIFEKFFRAENARNAQARGSGIGLYIAKVMIEASGGSIGFSSQEGKGSVFWFALPIIH